MRGGRAAGRIEGRARVSGRAGLLGSTDAGSEGRIDKRGQFARGAGACSVTPGFRASFAIAWGGRGPSSVTPTGRSVPPAVARTAGASSSAGAPSSSAGVACGGSSPTPAATGLVDGPSRVDSRSGTLRTLANPRTAASPGEASVRRGHVGAIFRRVFRAGPRPAGGIARAEDG